MDSRCCRADERLFRCDTPGCLVDQISRCNSDIKLNENTEDKCERQNLSGADVGAVSSVYAHVDLQVVVVGESLSTARKIALERLLPCVSQLVSV